MKSLKEIYGFNNTKKITTEELKNIILEEVKNISEDANPKDLDPNRFPPRLRAAGKDKEDADKDAVGGKLDGDGSDDVISVSSWSGNVGSLKPSQNSMDLYKLCNFFIAACKVPAGLPGISGLFTQGPGGKIDCIISSDEYIMDGHHRWGALCMYDPSTSVGPDIQLAFPALELIAVLNTITVHITGRSGGKEGKTPLATAFSENAIRGQIKKFMDNPSDCWAADKSEENLKKILQNFSGSDKDLGDELLDAVMNKISSNLSSSNLTPVSDGSGMFDREDMPVLSPAAGHVMKAAKMLAAGEVDVNPPYAKGEEANESKKNSDNVIMENWRRLAGIL